MFVERVNATSIAVSGTSNAAITTITVPESFMPIAGAVYDIQLKAQVPDQTDGTIISITNGTAAGEVMQRVTGDYARARGLGWLRAIRVQFFSDPDHYILVGVRA